LHLLNFYIAGQLDATPTAYIALAIFIITRRNRPNIAPATYIALAIPIITHSRHSTVRFKSDCMSITRVRRHMNITSRDCHNIAPTAYITLAIIIITHSLTVRSDLRPTV
jgi:hypothetical protein